LWAFGETTIVGGICGDHRLPNDILELGRIVQSLNSLFCIAKSDFKIEGGEMEKGVKGMTSRKMLLQKYSGGIC
jgi:hypothetical protein